MQTIRERLKDAELVLVGLGEAFQYDWGILLQDDRYHEITQEIGEDERYLWIVPFLQKMILRRGCEERWNHAYQALKLLLENKNYFVVSLSMDDYLYGAGLDEKRLVTPCGGFRKMQCDQNCTGKLYEMPEDSYEAVQQCRFLHWRSRVVRSAAGSFVLTSWECNAMPRKVIWNSGMLTQNGCRVQ